MENLYVDNQVFHVSEIFQSIQGEGNYAGVNSLFVRFQLCNLRCQWCDTQYSWTAHSGNYHTYSAKELKAKISESGVKHIIFTGGEPSLYQLDLLAEPVGLRYHVESNGQFIPDKPLNLRLLDGTMVERKAMDYTVFSQFNWVISPKLKNSKQPLILETLIYWALQDFAVFKFVVRTTNDLDEVEELIESAKINRDRVYIGLEGYTTESQMRPELVEEIIQRNLNFSPRLHILLWGNQRLK